MSNIVEGRKFWFVLNTNRKEAPQQKHWSYDCALAEAQRLANLQPQDEFVVLGAEAVVYQPPRIITIRLAQFEQRTTRPASHKEPSDEVNVSDDLPWDVDPPHECRF